MKTKNKQTKKKLSTSIIHPFRSILNDVKVKIESDYKRITNSSKIDPGTAGDQAEVNWAKIIREWIPKGYYVVEKGQIISETGDLSPQVDIIILSPSYPPFLLETKQYFYAGVVAAFECKLTLRNRDIDKFINNSVRIKNMCTQAEGSLRSELVHPICYGLLAHSYESVEIPKLHDAFLKKCIRIVSHPLEMPDMVCVGNMVTLTLEFNICIGKYIKNSDSDFLNQYEIKDGISCKYNMHCERVEGYELEGEILSAFILFIYSRLATSNPGIQQYYEYLIKVKEPFPLFQTMWWDSSKLSNKTIEYLEKNQPPDSRFSPWSKIL